MLAGPEAPLLGRPGADYMVDVLKSLDLEYVAINPSSNMRGLHESVINYGGNRQPELITCLHEEIAVGFAHGYSKMEGRPMAAQAHGTVGLQHASMALYNAWCDRAPLLMMVGNSVDAASRSSKVSWYHSAQDTAAVVRDYVKWDDSPASLSAFGESAVRAWRIASTPPCGPTLLVLDDELQLAAMKGQPRIPALPKTVLPGADDAAVEEVARLLVAAENPVILVDRLARTPAGLAGLVALAEATQSAVVDDGGRMNFPWRHPLNQTDRREAAISNADLVICLEVADPWSALFARPSRDEAAVRRRTKPGCRTVSIGVGDMLVHANFQDFQRFADVDLAILADGESVLPAVTEAVHRLVNSAVRSRMQARGVLLAEGHKAALARARSEAAYGWDSSPVSTARLCHEIWEALKREDFSLASATEFVSFWPQRTWPLTMHHQYIGHAGGYGIGYNAPAATGAALSNKKRGRITLSIQGDGDLNYVPATLWTAAHHRIPILYVMHNNRAYHQELLFIARTAAENNRPVRSTKIGSVFEDPFIDYSSIARGYGVHAEGPIDDPEALAGALKRAVAVVKSGQPALVDVLTEGR